MAPPVVKRFTIIKTSARINARAADVFGGYHIGVQKNCNRISPEPLDIDLGIDGNPASGMNEYRITRSFAPGYSY